MKKNIFFIVFIFSVLVSLSIQIQENNYYKKFLSNTENASKEEKDEEKGTDNPTDKEEKTDVNIKCLYVSKYNVYTLQKLIKDNGYTKELSKGKFKFNFCKNLEGVESTAI